MQDRNNKAAIALTLPMKGAEEYAVARALQDRKGLGYKRVVLNTE